ncbi:tape measure protein [Virgibacillus halophilus]|uniref:Tape measure protein n=1 Tax=Tigheibacillus halophilus TaxID=361280 RepID=A0ABU5C6V4_9BACI|nr:tape measure protein [Virgibacillus halophilus]
MWKPGGDAVAFYGDGSQEQFANVTDALAKMKTKGTVGMDQLNRLFDAGIDAVGMYAKATGKNADEVQKALSNGSISADDFIDTVSTAMMEGTNGVIKIKGAAKDAGATWGSTFANMKTAVARGVANIITSIDDMLTSNGLPDMRAMVKSFGDKFESVLSGIAKGIPAVINKIKGWYDAAQEYIGPVGDLWDSLKDKIEKFKEILSPIFDSMKNSFQTLLDSVGPIMESIGNLF